MIIQWDGRNFVTTDLIHKRVSSPRTDPFNEGLGCAPSGVLIVHWDGVRFVIRQIPVGHNLEHVSFAPIDIPALP